MNALFTKIEFPEISLIKALNPPNGAALMKLTEIGNKYKMNRHVIMNINNNVFNRQTKKFIKRDKPLRDTNNPPSLLDENGYKKLYILISPNKDLEYEKLFSSQA